jgi:hypothetical protein
MVGLLTNSGDEYSVFIANAVTNLITSKHTLNEGRGGCGRIGVIADGLGSGHQVF